ncbi:MAG TPA: sialidase family protein, partial [Anaerolineales bacterium]|nr:sialidase family protein [Anaerolineales bacterium]
ANLSNNAGASFSSQVAVSGVIVFVTWHDDTPGNLDILMKRSINSGGSFQAVKNLSNNAGSSINPQVATSGDNVYFTWQDFTPSNWEIFLRRSADDGATLQPLVKLSNNEGASKFPQVATFGANVYVIWQDNSPGNNEIIERRSHDNGATWQSTQNLSSNAGSSELPQ